MEEVKTSNISGTIQPISSFFHRVFGKMMSLIKVTVRIMFHNCSYISTVFGPFLPRFYHTDGILAGNKNVLLSERENVGKGHDFQKSQILNLSYYTSNLYLTFMEMKEAERSAITIDSIILY